MKLSFLRGEQLYLRALVEADADGPYVSWFNNAEVCSGNSHHIFPYTRDAALNYIGQRASSSSDLTMAVVLTKGDRHIGNIALQNIDRVNRSADFAIIIGERDCWGKGYSKQAAKLLCDHGFMALNLNRIACGTFETNNSMIRLAKSLGMQEEGRRREAAFKGGRYLDVIEFGVLQKEWLATQQRNATK